MSGQPAPRHIDRRIAELAGSQHRVISAVQLHALGQTSAQIDFRVSVGRLHVIERGVYAVGDASLAREGHWMASVLSIGADAVLSHRAAAAHWGLLAPTSGKIDVTLPRRTGRTKRERIRPHRVTSLPEDERTLHDGIPTTTLARTLLDLAGSHPRRLVERAVEESERVRLFDLTAIETLLERHARRPGTPLLSRVIDRYRDDHIHTRTTLERLFQDLCDTHDLPPPTVNAARGPFEVDFQWLDKQVIAETDGRDVHTTRAAFERDRARDAWLTAHGYRVVRFTWRQVTSAPLEVARVLRLLLSPRAGPT
jgi:predicted transcriptional regulator of viral defense system